MRSPCRAFLRIEATAQKAVREAEQGAADARQLALRFQAKAREVEPLLTEAGFRNECTRISGEARAAVQFAEQSAAGFRRSAERIQRAIDLTRYQDFRLKWSAIQESLVKRAKAAKAARDGYPNHGLFPRVEVIDLGVRPTPIRRAAPFLSHRASPARLASQLGVHSQYFD